ncbi:MAG: winged helix DNA-binding protein [Clostridia bacterium]|nr:winged helix DNA-binding protein [Clostridia bacterium]
MAPATLAHQLMESLHHINKLKRTQFSASGLKPNEAFILFHIKKAVQPHEAGITLSAISRVLMVTAPSVTPIIQNLEKQDLIERSADEKDKRAVRIKLTKKGESTVNKTWERFTNTYRELVEYMGAERTRELLDLLADVRAFLDQKQDNAD